MSTQTAALLDAVKTIARKAGERILEIYAQDFEIYEKTDKSPLTEADLAAHSVIVQGLEELTPDLPILSEESEDSGWDVRQGWQKYWLVDPLDGTKEFIKKNGEFTVNIALIENHKPVLGVVFAPAINRLYAAAEGAGAVLEVENQEPRPLVASAKAGDSPWRVVGSRSHPSPAVHAFLQCLGEHEMVAMGSSLKFCLVAEGNADIYPRLGPTSEWDTAAAQCVVEQAGGRVVDTDLNDLRYNTKPELLNPHFIVSAVPASEWSECLEGAES